MALTGLFTNQLRASRNPADSQVFEGDFLLKQYTAGSAASQTFELDIPASTDNPVILEQVQHYVKKAFTSDTTATIDVGDGSDDDLYIDQTIVTPATVGSGAASAVTLGKLLTANARIVATIGAALGGEGLIVAKLLHLKNA